MTVDLHALANMPGAGKATEALKAAGLWDEYSCDGPKIPFHVTLNIVCERSYKVEARSEAEAVELAEKEADDEFDGDTIEIYEVDVRERK